MGNFREPTNADLKVDPRNVHDGYSDFARRVKVDLPSFDGR